MLATALCIASALESQRLRDKRDEIKALAAALRGELMAARGVCFGRAKSITSDSADRTAIWPRIRSTLYQAYVGRLGFLGAELARQVASVYGQSSDYAALYNPVSGTFLEVTKRQALETLVKRIDEVLPKLAEIEKTGKLLPPHFSASHGTARHLAAASGSQTGLNLLSLLALPVTFLFGIINSILASAHNLALNSRVPQAEPHTSEPPHVTEYTAIIEADMERYQYTENVETAENVEPLNVPPHKKRSGRG